MSELPSPQILSGYLEEAEVARQLRITVRTLERWRRARTSPPFIMLGHRPIYKITSLEKWIASNEVEPVRPHFFLKGVSAK